MSRGRLGQTLSPRTLLLLLVMLVLNRQRVQCYSLYSNHLFLLLHTHQFMISLMYTHVYLHCTCANIKTVYLNTLPHAYIATRVQSVTRTYALSVEQSEMSRVLKLGAGLLAHKLLYKQHNYRDLASSSDYYIVVSQASPLLIIPHIQLCRH